MAGAREALQQLSGLARARPRETPDLPARGSRQGVFSCRRARCRTGEEAGEEG